VKRRPPGVLSALRSALFLLFQLVVTPLYAQRCWRWRGRRARGRTGWRELVRRQPVGRPLDLRHSLARGRPGEHSRDTRAAPHIVMSKHSSTWETLSLNQYFRRSRTSRRRNCCPSRSSAGASHSRRRSRSTARPHRRDAADGQAGPRAIRNGFWIVVYPEGTRIKAGTAPSTRPAGATRHRDGRADHPGRAQRRVPVAQGHLRQAAGNPDDDHRQADLPTGKDPPR